MRINELMFKAKHWQLFLILFGLPFLIYLVMIGVVFSQVMSESYINSSMPMSILSMYAYVIPVYLVIAYVYLRWMWAIGVGLRAYLPEGVELKAGFFMFTLLYPIVYFVLLFAFFLVPMLTSMADMDVNAPQFPFDSAVLIVVIPFHLFAFVSMLLSMRFAAKVFKSVELRRLAHFGDYAGEFFLIWFYFIGVWIIQPKINKIVSGETEESGEEHLILD